MVTSNIIQRVLKIQTRDGQGTAFVVEVDDRQYIITARHLVGDPGSRLVKLYHEKQWKDLEGEWIGQGSGGIDIAVFAAKIVIGRFGPVDPTAKDLVYSQDVYFLGFPYGFHGEMDALNNALPFPFVKKAIVSLMYNDGVHRIFIDGHNNPGFSGGPVVFKPAGSQGFRICSVISGFVKMDEPVSMGGKQTTLTYEYNTGIVLSIGINHALDLINARPVGPKIA